MGKCYQETVRLVNRHFTKQYTEYNLFPKKIT